jgi:RNA polymerase sigma-70 factor (ECF subfamily)
MRSWRPDDAALQRLYRHAKADRWSLSIVSFATALELSARRALAGEPPSARDLERYFKSLHLEDLALASACAEGLDAAWEHFVREYRPALYRAADAIEPGGAARDLADSLYAELFGLSERDGERKSHFRYFHGRSSLATWLRAVLSQRHVDRFRGMRRLDPLPEEDSPRAIVSAAAVMDPSWPRYVGVMQRAVTEAVERLAPRDRLRLACYYAQDLTLAQIGRTLGEHEATVSRHLARTRREIRKQVEHELRDRERMSEAEIVECFASVTENSGSLDVAELLGAGAVRKNVPEDRST